MSLSFPFFSITNHFSTPPSFSFQRVVSLQCYSDTIGYKNITGSPSAPGFPRHYLERNSPTHSHSGRGFTPGLATSGTFSPAPCPLPPALPLPLPPASSPLLWSVSFTLCLLSGFYFLVSFPFPESFPLFFSLSRSLALFSLPCLLSLVLSPPPASLPVSFYSLSFPFLLPLPLDISRPIRVLSSTLLLLFRLDPPSLFLMHLQWPLLLLSFCPTSYPTPAPPPSLHHNTPSIVDSPPLLFYTLEKKYFTVSGG